jgi:hypothetical protein
LNELRLAEQLVRVGAAFLNPEMECL